MSMTWKASSGSEGGKSLPGTSLLLQDAQLTAHWYLYVQSGPNVTFQRIPKAAVHLSWPLNFNGSLCKIRLSKITFFLRFRSYTGNIEIFKKVTNGSLSKGESCRSIHFSSFTFGSEGNSNISLNFIFRASFFTHRLLFVGKTNSPHFRLGAGPGSTRLGGRVKIWIRTGRI